MRTPHPIVFASFMCLAAARVAMAEPGAQRRDESVEYVRFGLTEVASHGLHGALGLTPLGFRHEFGRLAIDLSALSFATKESSEPEDGDSAVWTVFKVEALHFSSDDSNHAFYAGGGLSYGAEFVEAGRARYAPRTQTSWFGSGMQGELSGGCEWGRSTHLREFLQIDVTLPFYRLHSDVDHRYAPSLMVSYGLGWRHGGHRGP